jgi:tetratricopeptide (TPR) repeat protein
MSLLFVPSKWFGCTLTALLSCVHLAAQETVADQGDYAGILKDAERKLHQGQLTAAEAGFQELLDAQAEETPADAPPPELVLAARTGLWTIAFRRGRYTEVRDGIAGLPAPARAERPIALLLVQVDLGVGAYADAIASLRALIERDDGDLEARYLLGEALHGDGQRAAARQEWAAGVAAARPKDARGLAFLGRCHWRLGGRDHLAQGSRALVDALALDDQQPEARTTLGIMKFEAYGETAGHPSGEKDLNKVLEQCGDREETLLALYRLRSSNMMLDGGKTERLLQRVLELNPQSVEALVERGSGVLDDRRYRDAAEILDTALAINGNHKLALAHRAAAAYLLHDERSYAELRARALRGDPGWPDVDRILGDHLVALYRFADALPFYAAARAAAPDDVPTLHGTAKAMIYTGEGLQAKELLLRAKDLEPGYVDAWRNNALAVQALLDAEYGLAEAGDFAVQLHRDDSDVLREYLLPLHLRAAEELGRKYDYRPDGKVKTEVFHTWDDFSVRTIGFRGFTALGACFGRFLTLVSPVDADVRRQEFMWEATVWHEYTHVLTLGLSKHRVPRWLTEGFSVYEEKVRDPAWERGMDRELFDAFHNQDIPPIRLLNRLFRGPRILFGYYQGGLIVDLIARDHGFAKAIALLQAFGDDLDTEEAFERALGTTSRDFDQRLLEFIERDKLRGMKLVPRFDEAAMQRLQVRASADPTNLQARVDLAWGCIKRGNPVDAGRFLAEVLRRDPEHGQALLARAELLRNRGALDEAMAAWRRGFAAGADDFDSRVACGRVLLAAGQTEAAEEQWQRAKACWPGCTEQENAPELLLARLYREQDRAEQALMELKAYCKRSGRAFRPRWELAEFERQAGHRDAEVRYLEACNGIDPFMRDLHVLLGEGYESLGRKAEAAREYEVAAAVLPELDRKYLRPGEERPAADAPAERAARGGLWLRAAELRKALGDDGRAAALVARVLQAAAGTEAATAAEALQAEWRRR